jgi:hypothetical protein
MGMAVLVSALLSQAGTVLKLPMVFQPVEDVVMLSGNQQILRHVTMAM